MQRNVTNVCEMGISQEILPLISKQRERRMEKIEHISRDSNYGDCFFLYLLVFFYLVSTSEISDILGQY